MPLVFIFATILLMLCRSSAAANITLGAGTLTNYTITSGNTYTAHPNGTTLAGKIHEGPPEPQKKSRLRTSPCHGFAKPHWRSRILRGDKWKAVAHSKSAIAQV